MFWYNLKENLLQERSRWIPWVPVLFGIGIGVFFALPMEPSLWWGLGLAETLIFQALIFRRRPEILAVLGIVSIAALGFISVQLRTAWLNKVPFVSGEQKMYLKGRIIARDTNSTGKIRLTLDDISDFDDNKLSGPYKITLLVKKAPAAEGQCVEMIAKIMPPFPTAMVGGYQFDRKTFFDGIKATGYSVSRAIPIDCVNSTPWTEKVNLKIEQIRDKIVRRIDTVLPPDEAAVTAAIVAGERGGMSRELINNYRDSGLAHFLSISGLHMSMLAGMMFFLVRFVSSLVPPVIARYDTKKFSAVFAILMSAVYLVISGAAVPTQRAFIMTFIVLLGVLCSRQAISMLTISWAAMLVLLISPEALIGPSFQMSFAAVIVLIAFYERYAGSLHRFLNGGGSKNVSLLSRAGRIIFAYIAGILISDFVASMATLPFSIYHFNRIAVYTTLGNLLAGPVIGLVIMPFVLLSLLLMPLGLEELPLKIVGWGIHLVNDVTAWVASLPHAGLPVLAMPLWGLVAIVLGALWLCIWQRKWRLWGWTGILAGCLSLLAARVPDVMVDESGKAVAVKDNRGELVVLPSRGKTFVKNIWLEKTGGRQLSEEDKKKLRLIWNGKREDKNWLDLTCDKTECFYKGRITIEKNKGIKLEDEYFDSSKALGAAISLLPEGFDVNTVRSFVGERYWNKN